MMTDETPVNTDEIIEREEIVQPPRRGRGRPRKVQSTEATFDGTEPDPKPKRGRRSSKLTGENVADLVAFSSNIMVMSTGHPHWLIDPSECKPFAGQLADILNRVPARYVKAFTDLNGYAIVGFGLYSVFGPRIAAERAIRHQERLETARERRTDLVQDEMRTWDIPSTTEG